MLTVVVSRRRDRVDLDQVLGIRQRGYSHNDIGWLVIAKQRYWGLLDDRQ